VKVTGRVGNNGRRRNFRDKSHCLTLRGRLRRRGERGRTRGLQYQLITLKTSFWGDECYGILRRTRAAHVPVRSTVYRESRLVVTVEEGRVTFNDMLANQDRLLNDPDFDPEFNQLSDATLATDTDLSPANVPMLYERKVFSGTSRRAVVAPTNFAYGMARMLQAYVDLSDNAHPVHVFRDRQSALRWLGVPEDFRER